MELSGTVVLFGGLLVFFRGLLVLVGCGQVMQVRIFGEFISNTAYQLPQSFSLSHCNDVGTRREAVNLSSFRTCRCMATSPTVPIALQVKAMTFHRVNRAVVHQVSDEQKTVGATVVDGSGLLK